MTTEERAELSVKFDEFISDMQVYIDAVKASRTRSLSAKAALVEWAEYLIANTNHQKSLLATR